MVSGLLLTTKFSSFALLPMIAVLLAVRVAANRPLTLVSWRGTSREILSRGDQMRWLLAVSGLTGLLSVVVIWLCYLPQLTLFADPGGPAIPWDRMPREGMLAKLTHGMNALHLLPEPYLLDLWVFDSSAGGRRAFLGA